MYRIEPSEDGSHFRHQHLRIPSSSSVSPDDSVASDNSVSSLTCCNDARTGAMLVGIERIARFYCALIGVFGD